MESTENIEKHDAGVLLERIREIVGEDGSVVPAKARKIHAMVLERQQDPEKLGRQCQVWLRFYGGRQETKATQAVRP